MKINQEKCDVNKRRLVLDFDLDGINHRYIYDGWSFENNATSELTVGDVTRKIEPIEHYKHCLQVSFMPKEDRYGDRMVFIDRRYEHNSSYDVYYAGKHYLVGSEDLPTHPTSEISD